jgi:hypothetical protein
MSSRRNFLRYAGLGATAPALSRCVPEDPRDGGAGTTGAIRQAPDRPNVLLITTDYQSALDVSTIGHCFLDKPTLGRLCRQGAVSRRHYSTAPIRVPARNTWITGHTQTRTASWENVGGWVPGAHGRAIPV